MEGIVYIGKKPVKNYVVAVLAQLTNNNKVTIKARGKAIAKAVDVAEIVRNRVLRNIKIENIEIGTDKVKDKDGRDINISYISITLSK
ncbi:DNA-binding protein Alba [Methanocaldococcus indicus]|uniref:DNA-binding protein Alba n=1 Tax=Methanocaldococcus indicus TaxID=213231 RepID=UPI003C6D2601